MGFEILILLLILPVCVSLYWIVKFLHEVWWSPIQIQSVLRSQAIGGPPYKFLYGNTKQMFSMITEARNRKSMPISHEILPMVQPYIYLWMKTYGKTFLTWLGPKAQLMITEPELIKEILNNKDGSYAKRKTEGLVKMWLGDSLVTAEGEKWVRKRKLANHAFHGEILKGMVPAMIKATEIMLERWKNHEGKEIEVFEEFRLLTYDVISRTAFGSNYEEGMNIFKMSTKLGSIAVANSLKIRLPGIGNFLRHNDDIEAAKLEEEIRKSVRQIIRKREEMIKSGELDGYGSDYLGLLVKANLDSDEDTRISIGEIVDECKTFYIAGHETTTSLLTSLCLLLAFHTDWQDKARREVFDVFGETNRPDDSSISRLKTMTMIINETLRLYPPILILVRKVTRELRLGKLMLPANIEVTVPILALHNDPTIWGEDAHIFKPERFSEGVVKATNNNATAFLPFGIGPRNCVGLSFAVNETKIALSLILQRYEFTLSPAYVHSPVQMITTRPQHGLQIILHPYGH